MIWFDMVKKQDIVLYHWNSEYDDLLSHRLDRTPKSSELLKRLYNIVGLKEEASAEITRILGGEYSWGKIKFKSPYPAGSRDNWGNEVTSDGLVYAELEPFVLGGRSSRRHGPSVGYQLGDVEVTKGSDGKVIITNSPTGASKRYHKRIRTPNKHHLNEEVKSFTPDKGVWLKTDMWDSL